MHDLLLHRMPLPPYLLGATSDSRAEGNSMRIVVAVDSTDRAFTALGKAINPYNPEELVLLHVVALGPLESYALVP